MISTSVSMASVVCWRASSATAMIVFGLPPGFPLCDPREGRIFSGFEASLAAAGNLFSGAVYRLRPEAHTQVAATTIGTTTSPFVNAGAKMYRRAGVKMHHGGLPEGG
jgi:hypothetical protein